MPDTVLDTVLTTISRYNMLASGKRVAVAVSGGADSVCLFYVLRELGPRAGFTVAAVAHLNHRLRGADSDADEQAVAELAARNGVAFHRAEARVIETRGNLEQAARRARHALFSNVVKENIADRIATGHTADDQAETVLFRLLRGAGPAGLAGILPVTREGLIRPLLHITRAQTEEFLRSRGIPWREDASNQQARFARNRIRHTLLPQLAREWNPHIGHTLANLADVAREEERWWREEISRISHELLNVDDYGIEINARRLTSLPRAVARRLIRYALDDRTDFDHVEQILALATKRNGDGRVDLPGRRVERSFDWLRFTRNCEARPIPVRIRVPGSYPWPPSITVHFEIADALSPSPCGLAPTHPCARLKLCERGAAALLELRGWIAGDHYRPAGYSRDQKLKELFSEARVPLWRRQFWPIVSNGTRILWSRGFGAAADAIAGPEPGPVLHIWEEGAEERPKP